ncbi:MAG: hypothetical protein JRJ87_10605 [Deltaproteobacteria bacterium]|nr:hypothetical protein [Deltaproteobacteria bacterium]
MRKTGITIALIAGLMIFGCGDKKKAEKPIDKPKVEKPKIDKPIAVKPKAEAPKAEAPKAEAPKTPGPEVAQCEKILSKSWTTIQPALKMLKIADPASLEDGYKKSAKTYLERCQLLPKELRDCLEAADNPVSGIDTCKVNEGKKSNEKLYAPDLRRHIKLFEIKPLDKKRAKKILAGLRGRWVNDWKAAKLHTTWKIKKTGEVAERRKGHGGKIEQRNFKISFVETNRMKMHWTETSTQSYIFLRAGRKMFFASGNLVYDFFPMLNPKSFIVRDSGDYIVYNKGKCKVVNETGRMTDGKCKFLKIKGKRAFKATWQYPGQVFLNGKPRMLERNYYVIGKNLVHESLYVSGKYLKK